MITEKDLNPELIETLSEQHKNILIDFANSFLETFGNIISKDDLIERINKIKYIGFENTLNEHCKDCDAIFIDEKNSIFISKNKINSDANIIKSLLYHELIHAISVHSEINLDTENKESKVSRTGLRRDDLLFHNNELPIFEGNTLEEIMTEYYNTVLLQKEGIDFNGTYTLTCKNKYYNEMMQNNMGIPPIIEPYEYYGEVEYHGTGYINLAALGKIYNFLFGDELLKAKLYDGNNFRTKFNELFDNTNIFKDVFVKDILDYKVDTPSYSKFAFQKNPIDRYRTACEMFVEIFKQKYKNKINTINDLLDNPDFNTFLNMLVKTREEFSDEKIVKEELFLLTKKLEKDMANELFGNKSMDNEYGLDTDDIETSIFLAIERIYNDNKKIDLNSIKYSVFYDKNFKGVYLIVGDDKFIIDYKTISQEFDYAKFKKFSDLGYSKEEIDSYSRNYKMDLSNAEVAPIKNIISSNTFILNNEKLYNKYGQEIDLKKLKTYSTNVIDNQRHI